MSEEITLTKKDVNLIVTILLNSPSISELCERWTDFARILALPNLEVYNIKRKYISYEYTIGEVLTEVLMLWMSKQSKKATLAVLVNALNEDMLVAASDDILKKFPTTVVKPDGRQEIESKQSCEDQKSNVTAVFALLLSLIVLISVLSAVKFFITDYFPLKKEYNASLQNQVTNYQNKEYLLPDYIVGKETEVVATNYNEVVESMRATQGQRKISLFVSLENPYGWPRNATIIYSHLITKVTFGGLFSLEIINEILSQLVNIQHLTFDNRLGRLCDRKAGRLSQALRPPLRLKFKTLVQLQFINFTTCYDISESFALQFEKLNIATLQFLGGVINDENIYDLQEMLVRSTTLKTVIMSVQYVTNFTFYKSMSTASNIKEIYFESPSVKKPKTLLRLDNTFCKVFTNLERFYTGKISYQDFMHLTKCNTLKVLKLEVEFIDTDVIIEPLWKYHFPQLEYIDIKFQFNTSECPTESQLSKIGIHGLKSLVFRYSICFYYPTKYCKLVMSRGMDFNECEIKSE